MPTPQIADFVFNLSAQVGTSPFYGYPIRAMTIRCKLVRARLGPCCICGTKITRTMPRTDQILMGEFVQQGPTKSDPTRCNIWSWFVSFLVSIHVVLTCHNLNIWQ